MTNWNAQSSFVRPAEKESEQGSLTGMEDNDKSTMTISMTTPQKTLLATVTSILFLQAEYPQKQSIMMQNFLAQTEPDPHSFQNSRDQ